MLKKHFFRTTYIACCVMTLSAGLVGCGDRYESAYNNGDREPLSLGPDDPNANIQPPPAPGEPDPENGVVGPSSMSGIWALDPDNPNVQLLLANNILSDTRVLLAEGNQADYLELYLCERENVLTLTPIPNSTRAYQLNESILGLDQAEIYYMDGAPLVVAQSLLAGEVRIPMRKVEGGDLFTMRVPEADAALGRNAICGSFGQSNARMQSNVYGKFNLVAQNRIHTVDVRLPNGLSDPSTVTATVAGSWYSYIGGETLRTLAGAQMSVDDCVAPVLDFELTGTMPEGDWSMSLLHRTLSPNVNCPGDYVDPDPAPDVIQEEGEDVIQDDPQIDPDPQDPPNNEEVDPIEIVEEEEEEVPVEPTPEEEDPGLPVPEEEAPPPPIEPPPLNEEPLEIGEATCLPEERPLQPLLSGRWLMNDAILAFIPEDFEFRDEISNQLANSVFILDQETELAVSICESDDVYVDLLRNGDALVSEELDAIVATQDLVTLDGITVDNDALIKIATTANLGDVNLGLTLNLERQLAGPTNVCWDSNLLPDIQETKHTCAAAQAQGLRLVFAVENELMAVNFALPEQPDVGTYVISEAYPATLVSDLFVASGLETRQKVVKGTLEVESIGQNEIVGRFRIVTPWDEDVTVAFKSYYSRVAVEAPPVELPPIENPPVDEPGVAGL